MSNIPETPFSIPTNQVIKNELFENVDWSLPFYIVADHAQVAEEVSFIQVEYYSISEEDTVAEEDVEDYDDDDIIRVNVVYGS